MKIILGQGNPGDRYQATRHNVGWLLLDSLSGGAEFRTQAKFFAATAEIEIAHEKVLLVKPSTFYNETGRTARALLDFYKIAPENLMVIHDDLALPFGTIRVRQKGSDAGNNGIKSLNAHISQDFWRMRVGVWNTIRDRQPDADFVLSRFSKVEHDIITQNMSSVAETIVQQFCENSLTSTSIQVPIGDLPPAAQ